MTKLKQTLKNSAYNSGLNLLAFREHSRYELVEKLQNKEFLKEEVLDAVERLQSAGLQSDERFSQAFVRSWANKGRGQIRIDNDLKRHKISDNYLTTMTNQIDWLEKTHLVWQKKFKALPKDRKEKAKQFRFLQQRGFAIEDIQTVLSNKTTKYNEI